MDIFQRNIHLNAKKIDDDHMQVESSLLDLEHSFNLEITVRVSNHTIEKVTASITKAPFTHCLAALDNFTRSLEGLSIERGIVKQIHSRLGGPKGCAHLLELLNDTVRFTSMLLLGQSMGVPAGTERSPDGRRNHRRRQEEASQHLPRLRRPAGGNIGAPSPRARHGAHSRTPCLAARSTCHPHGGRPFPAVGNGRNSGP